MRKIKTQQLTVQDLLHISAGNLDLVHKSVGVLLHDSGFMRYAKLTAENYYYWWHEAENKYLINKKGFTYSWADMEKTSKFDFLMTLVDYHKPAETIGRIINNALNIISALGDGINKKTGIPAWQEVFDMYYSGEAKRIEQMEFAF